MTEMEEIKTMLADMNKKLDRVVFQNKITLNTKYGLPITKEKEEEKTMTKNKQIEEMGQIICGRCKDGACIIDRTSCDSICNWARTAEALYNAGCRRIDNDCAVITKDELKQYKVQAVKEFAEKLKSEMLDREYNGIHYKWGAFSDNEIDELLKEHYK